MEGRLAYKDALEPPLLIIVPNKHQHIVAHTLRRPGGGW